MDADEAVPIKEAQLKTRASPLHLSARGKELALMHFNHVEQQVGLAATTAALIVAADAVIVGAYVNVVTHYKVFQELGASLAGIAFGIAGALLILAFVLALLAAFPNLSFKTFQLTVENILFFGKIGSQSFGDYLRDFQAKDDAHELDRELLHQIWAKSRWLAKMFRWLQGAVACSLAGTVMAVVVLLFVGHKLPA